MSTLIFATGFEFGTTAGLIVGNATNRVFDAATTVGTNMFVEAGAARSGSFGLRLAPSASTVNVGWMNASNSGILGTTGILVASFYFRFPTLPAANFEVFTVNGTVGGHDSIIRFTQFTGTIDAILGGTVQTGPSISANTWYRIDLLSNFDADPHTLDWSVDGTTQTQVTLAGADEDVFQARLGSTGNQTGTIHFDDVVLSITSADHPLGQHKIVGLSVDPAGTVTLSGTTTNFQTFAGATPTLTAWNATTARNNVDELPPNLTSAQDGFCQINLATTDYVQCPLTTYTLQAGETVNGLRVLVCGWQATTSSATIGVRTFNGTTETTLLAAQAHTNLGNNTASPGWICKMATLADFNTQGELDALAVRAGFSGDATPDIGVQAIYAEVAVAVTSGTQFNISPTGSSTPAGAVARQDAKTLTAAASSTGATTRASARAHTASTTPTGTTTRSTLRTTVGSITSGSTLAAVKLAVRAFAGSIASTGAVARLTGRVLTGASTPAGVDTRLTARTTTGTSTSSGSVVPTRLVVRVFTGAIAVGAALVRVTTRPVGGSVQVGGTTTRGSVKTLTGSVTSVGALSSVRAVILAFAGAVTSVGQFTRRPAKTHGSTTGPTGVATRATLKTHAGTVTSTGTITVIRAALRTFTGAITALGALTRRDAKSAVAQVSPVGLTTKQDVRTHTGTIQPTGASTYVRTVVLLITAAVTGVGEVVKTTVRDVAGTIQGDGTLMKLAGKTVDGLVNVAAVTALLLNPDQAATALRIRLTHRRSSTSAAGREAPTSTAGREPDRSTSGEEDRT